MTEPQINQIIGQLVKSADMFEETEASEPEYQDYCDHLYSCVAYWRNQLRELRLKNKET